MPGSTKAPFASEPFRGKSANGPWGDAIEEIDWSTGQILDKLIELKIERHTLVVWLSDNGAPLARNPEETSRGSNRPFHGRGYTTAEGAFRSPTIMWWPGTIPASTTCDELATTMDLLPTCTHLAGGIVEHDIDGHDIRSLLTDDHATTPYEVFYFYSGSQLQAVRQGPWKLFLPLSTFASHPHFKRGERTEPLLFDVVNDVGSERNVAANHPEIVERLTALAQAAKEDLGDQELPGKGQRPPGKISGDPHPVVGRQAAACCFD